MTIIAVVCGFFAVIWFWIAYLQERQMEEQQKEICRLTWELAMRERKENGQRDNCQRLYWKIYTSNQRN